MVWMWGVGSQGSSLKMKRKVEEGQGWDGEDTHSVRAPTVETALLLGTEIQHSFSEGAQRY